MIEVKKVSFGYTKQNILTDISFDINAGEITCLLGRSGLGKTTLLNILVGLLQPDSGGLIAPFPRPSREVAYLNQSAGLLPWRTAEQNIYLGEDLLGITLDENLIKELINLLGLGSRLSSYPSQLSGGELQRFALIQRLVLTPKFLVLDEPFAALDIVLRRDLSNLVREIVQTRKLYCMVVTHQPEDALFLADEILILSKGCEELGASIHHKMKRDMDFNESSSYMQFVEAIR